MRRALVLLGSALFFSVFAFLTWIVARRGSPPSGALGKLHAIGRSRRRFRKGWSAIASRRPLWCHVASAGELEEAIPVLEQLRAEEPTLAVVVTCFSASGLAALEREEKRRVSGTLPWDLAGPIEPDLPLLAARFVEGVRPSRALFVHRELWPWHLRALEQTQVPCALVQVRAERPRASWRVFAPWLRRFVMVGTVDDRAAAVMRAVCGAGAPVETLGDARVDRIVERIAGKVTKSSADGRRVAVVLASIWPEDLEALRPLFTAKELHHRPLVVVPHEPHPVFLAAIERELVAAGWVLRPTPRAPGEAELVGTVGGLAERYADAAIAFVGGSFRKRVHNVLEPAFAGCAVVTGPLTKNAPDARALEVEGGLRHVRDAADLRRVLALWDDGVALERARGAARRYVESRQGAGLRTARALRRAWAQV